MSTPLISSVPNDKSDTFNNIQIKYFGKLLLEKEEIILSRDQFKMICDDCHEHGRLRERATKGKSLKLS